MKSKIFILSIVLFCIYVMFSENGKPENTKSVLDFKPRTLISDIVDWAKGERK